MRSQKGTTRKLTRKGGLMYDICTRCKNRESCQRICRPVELWMKMRDKEEGIERPFLEKYFPDKIISYPTNAKGHVPEHRFCELTNFDIEQIEAPEIEKDDLDGLPEPKKQMKAKVFYRRFFLKQGYERISKDLGIQVQTCRSHYELAKKTIFDILRYMDARRSATRFLGHNKLPQAEVWFILCRGFGLAANDVADMWPGKAGAEWVNRNVREVEKKYVKKLAMTA